MKQVLFRKMISWKVIITFLIACTALFLAWRVSRIAFNEMLNTVQTISEPNEKLSIVNNLYRRITLLEQLQRSLSAGTDKQAYSRESRMLMHSMDTLQRLYANDNRQVRRIETMKALLRKREKLFADYLQVREAIVNNRALNVEVNNLNEILQDNSKIPDSITVWMSESKSTTIIQARREETPAGLLRRIFGKKKTGKTDTIPQKIVSEELSITVDTVTSSKNDSLYKTLDSALVSLQEKQKEQTGRFLIREKQLSDAGHSLVSQMLDILEQVEAEGLRQAEANHATASLLVAGSSRQIKLIIIAFIIATAGLLYFILTDIARNNKYRKMLEDANHEANYHSMAKQRFLANMSHEIRTPLQAIMGYAELARQENTTDPYKINAIYNSSEHLLQIVNEVLDYSNIISGKFSFSPSVFCLPELLEETLSVIRVQADKKSLQLLHDYDLEADLHLEGDPFRLKQIIYNLLGNAIKFTDKGSVSIHISGKQQDDQMHLSIRVEDTGIGMDTDDMSRIFSEFERTENTVNECSRGTGLGLSIVKVLVESQGGRIYVKSERGKGSCFSVFIPYPLVLKPVKTLAAIAEKRPQAYTGVVWLVDDDRFILELCSSIFEKNHIAYRCFSNSEAMLAADPDKDLTCVLLDMRMPGMDGAGLCRALRKTLPSGMYIFAMTAQALPWEQEAIMRQGFDGLLMKPFRERELIELVLSSSDTGFKEPLPDMSLLERMTFGDKTGISLILKQFVEDSRSDSLALAVSVEKKSSSDTLLILHRMAGRIAQIGAADLAAGFRKAELSLNGNTGFTEEFRAKIRELKERLYTLESTISEKIYETDLL